MIDSTLLHYIQDLRSNAEYYYQHQALPIGFHVTMDKQSSIKEEHFKCWQLTIGEKAKLSK